MTHRTYSYGQSSYDGDACRDCPWQGPPNSAERHREETTRLLPPAVEARLAQEEIVSANLKSVVKENADLRGALARLVSRGEPVAVEDLVPLLVPAIQEDVLPMRTPARLTLVLEAIAQVRGKAEHYEGDISRTKVLRWLDDIEREAR